MLFATVLSVAISVGGCCWPISAKGRLPRGSCSMTVFKTNLTVMHPWLRCRNISRDAAFYMHQSVLRGASLESGTLDFGPGKLYPLALLHATGSDV